MPPQNCRRLDEQRLLAPSRQHPAERRQHGAIGCPDSWASDLTPEHVQLVPKNEDLQLLRPIAATAKHEQLEQAANRPVEEGQDREQQRPSAHPPTLRLPGEPAVRSTGSPAAAAAAHERRSSFWDPHVGRAGQLRCF
jgi:hypothetical protein